MRHLNRRNWKSRFARFVQSYGVGSLAVQLDVRPSAIYHWIRGTHTPRPAHAEIMQRLARESGLKLTFDQIYQHSRDLRALECKSATSGLSQNGIPREQVRSYPLNHAVL